MLGRSLVAVALALSGASSVEAFWRLPCNNPLTIERADPIVSPGSVGGHVHNILGGSNFGLSTTFEELRASECTSCGVKQDMSNYWTPQLYFQWANGSFTSVDINGGGLIYYLLRYNDADTTPITAFPDHFRMLVGNPFKRTYDASSEMDQAIGWNCLGAPVSGDARQPYLPPYDCPNGLRGEIRFPSCWDGVNGDSSDHFSHMAYPIGGEAGACPSSHPVRTVTLFYEISWNVAAFNSLRSQALNPTQPFVLAMGDSSGYGYHGDFFNGWDGAVLQEAINTCTSPSGVIEECAVFDLYSSTDMCRRSPDVDEVVLGTLAALPGCNPVVGAGGVAAPCSAGSTPATLNGIGYAGAAPPVGTVVTPGTPTVLTSYDSSIGSQWKYRDCYSDLVDGRALPNGLTTKNKTVEACLEACDAAGLKICGVEYHGECWGANALVGGSTAQGASACGLVCDDHKLQYCGGQGGVSGAAMELYTRQDAVFTYVPPFVAAPVTTVVLPPTTSASQTSSSSAAAAQNTSTSAAPVTTTSAPVTTSASVSTSTSSKTRPKVRFPRFLPFPPDAQLVVEYGCFVEQLVFSLARSLLVFIHLHLDQPQHPPEVAHRYDNHRPPQQQLFVVGRPHHLLVYVEAGLLPRPGSTTSRSSSSSSSSASSSSTSATKTFASTSKVQFYVAPTATPSTKLATNPYWLYQGCWSDLVNGGRSLPNYLAVNKWTVQTCLDAALAANYSIAGLTYHGECWAADALSPYSVKNAPEACNFACSDETDLTCGGDKLLDVYYNRVMPQIKGPTMAQIKTFGNWTYDNCYSDMVDNQRSLPTPLVNANKTIEACLDACQSNSATVCGLSYGGECYMTTTDISSASTVIDDTSCRYPCAGNPLEMCGGSDALTIYRFSSSSAADTAAKTRRSYYERKQQVQRKALPPLRT
ncbi:hypothetical protein JCM8097_005827 [Rhodosporidiobolus ruineniae]